MAKHKHAFGYCDRSGFRYPLNELVEQYIDGTPSGLLVGKDMVDIDHEQLKLGEVDSNDKQSLDNPRPDRNLEQSRAISGWNPVGWGPYIPPMTGHVGTVKVDIT